MMRAMVLRGTELVVDEMERPAPGPMQVLARVRACGICGSDLHFARYAEEMINASRASDPAGWSAVDLTRGVVMGHEFVAEVVEAGAGAEAWAPGTRVTSVPVLPDPSAPRGIQSIGYSSTFPGAYGEYVVMAAPLLLRVPEGIPDRVAATTEPCAVGLHAVREARMQPGERALVMGAGPIGLMTLLWLKQQGIGSVTVSEYSAPRRALAQRLGADLVLDPATDDVGAQLVEAGGPPDVVFECVGVEGTLRQAIDLAARRGRVVVVGVCMTEDRIRPMTGINKHLTLQFVLGYTPEEYQEALESIGDGRIDPSPLVTRTVTLDELPGAFQALSDPTECKVVLDLT
jgi:2-desacetyl-2-hydroxyethyl bacteriochlorophyllide A dehydrogenase